MWQGDWLGEEQWVETLDTQNLPLTTINQATADSAYSQQQGTPRQGQARKENEGDPA